jgi:hypothetical protein
MLPFLVLESLKCSAQRLHQNYEASVAIVSGTESAQYIQNWRDTAKDERPASLPGSNEKKLVPKIVCATRRVKHTWTNNN